MIDHHFENMLSNKNEFRSWEMDHWSWVKGMSVGHGCGSWVMGYRAWAWGLGTWSNWSSRFTIHLYFIYYQNQAFNVMGHDLGFIGFRVNTFLCAPFAIPQSQYISETTNVIHE